MNAVPVSLSFSFSRVLSALIQFPDICSDQKQLLYTFCTYVYPSGGQCASPIPLYLTPPLCGGHCDTALSSPTYLDNKKPHETPETPVPKEVVTTPISEGVNDGVTEKATASDRSTESVLKESSSVGVRMDLVKSEGGEEEQPMKVVTKDTTDGVLKNIKTEKINTSCQKSM